MEAADRRLAPLPLKLKLHLKLCKFSFDSRDALFQGVDFSA